MELNTDIKNWPLDLLVDYVLKIYHRDALEMMPIIQELLDSVETMHSDTHPEIHEVKELFTASVYDLDVHFQKEENVLYPYVIDMYNAVANGSTPEPIHCGSVAHPISVMVNDHEGETERYERISSLTDNYATSDNNSNIYNLLMSKLQIFNKALLEHIYLENEIIFPKAVEFESKYIG